MRNFSILLLLLFAVGSASSFAQKDRFRSDLLIIEGNCCTVLNLLNSEFKNDSIAVSCFMRDYILVNPLPKKILNQKPKKVIEYYNRIENKELRCIHKKHYYSTVLLNK
ncbi:hypothetical protein EO244_11145 [Ancylomarina salipaludis]|uniref:Uncharacterized protein n=1 Tax=Ancylomarina salipaludis TaxID=2501299 RepID=A0A4Q1JKS7_9BACT|nr:hypothetical protein [Ancylomarina salipaludis]RXQ93019.1 hypothetical protein EO244_11145 [Ancylomarina salipaludis]